MTGDQLLQARFDGPPLGLYRSAGVTTKRYRKPTNTKVAPASVMQTIAAEAQLAVIALSD